MAQLATQVVTPSGLVPTFAAATVGGDTCNPGSGGSFLVVKNGGGAPITVTIDDPLTPIPGGSNANPDSVIVVTNATERWIALDPNRHARPSDGLAAITYTGVTSVTVACIQGPGR